MAVDTIANYVCHSCGKRPGAGVIRMRDFLPGVKHSMQYLCGVCLGEYVANGEIVIRLGDTPDAAAPAANDTYTVPVTTDDDGSIAVGDIEFRFE